MVFNLRKKMHAANRSIPHCSIIPEIGYRDVPGAARWLQDHFDFRERLRIADHRVQMTFGDGAFVLIQSEHQRSQSLLIRVTDIDARFEKARSSDLKIVRSIANYPYGERQFTVGDPEGHLWTFTQTIFDADPASWGGQLLLPHA